MLQVDESDVVDGIASIAAARRVPRRDEEDSREHVEVAMVESEEEEEGAGLGDKLLSEPVGASSLSTLRVGARGLRERDTGRVLRGTTEDHDDDVFAQGPEERRSWHVLAGSKWLAEEVSHCPPAGDGMLAAGDA